MKNLLLLSLFFLAFQASAQDRVQIGFINDRPPDSQREDEFNENIKAEILQLLQYRYQFTFQDYYLENNEQVFQQAYAENDMVLTIGVESSAAAFLRTEFTKPTIASIALDPQLQQLKKNAEGNSGVPNLTYLESPFNIKRDLALMKKIYPFDHLLIVREEQALGQGAFFEQLFKNYLEDDEIGVSSLSYRVDHDSTAFQMVDKRVAAYVLPYFGDDEREVQNIFSNLNQNQIPSAALFGEDYLNQGALFAYESEDNLQKLPRRIALNIMKILEGQAAEDLSVEMQTFSENLLINMETAREINVFPNFDLMAQATLINLERKAKDNKLSLQGAVAEALQRNLDIRVAQADVSISETEVGIARADLLPQVDLSSSFSTVDEITALSYQGAQGQTNWLLSGQFSQIVLAEPALANVAIQRMLKESEEQALLQTQLDVIIDVANAYINILLAKSNLNINQENVARNKENYDIAKAKEQIGYTGAADINRWEAELANANINLNNAVASLRQAKFQLNQLLNRPVGELLEIEDITLEETMLLIADKRAREIENHGQIEIFADFLVQFAKERLPELGQIDMGLAVQKRLQLSRERALYLPTMALNGSVNRVLGKYRVPEVFDEFDNVTTWNLSLGASLPIFQGNSRRKLIEQSRLNVIQLEDSRKNLENQLELRVRANMENVAASFSAVELSGIAAVASKKNYDIVQDAYSAGQSNVTNLIDAQNAALQSELAANNAVYAFILDFLLLERSIGFYNFTATAQERDAFILQSDQYFIQRGVDKK